MAGRCGCASDRCTCTIIAGDGVSVAGNGSPDNAYVISAVLPEAGGGGGDGRFSGEMVLFAGPVAPAGWLTCNGAEASRSVYASLFAVIGTAYGAGDGATTFNLPNMAGRVPLGNDGSHARGTIGGTSHLAAGHMPAHTHSINHTHPAVNTTSGGTHNHQLDLSTAVGSTGANVPLGTATQDRQSNAGVEPDGAHSHSITMPPFTGTSGSSGSGSPDELLPPYTSVNYIIKA